MALDLDHIVVCVPDLTAAARDFEDRLGLTSVEGGRHSGHGTANRLIPLGDSYIELLAVVEAKQAKTSPLGTWAMHRAAVPGADAVCLRTDDIECVSERFDLQTMTMSRVTPDGVILNWRLAGLKQALASGVPFFIQWDIPDDLHPGCTPVEHAAGAVGLGSVTISGDLEQLSPWANRVPRLEARNGDPGVTFELTARSVP